MAEQMCVKMHHYLMTGHTGPDQLVCTSYGQAWVKYERENLYKKYQMKQIDNMKFTFPYGK